MPGAKALRRMEGGKLAVEPERGPGDDDVSLAAARLAVSAGERAPGPDPAVPSLPVKLSECLWGVSGGGGSSRHPVGV